MAKIKKRKDIKKASKATKAKTRKRGGNSRSGKPLVVRQFEDDQKKKKQERKEQARDAKNQRVDVLGEEFSEEIAALESTEQSEVKKKESTKDKAYKLVALQEGISNSQAKSLIDRGLVYVGPKKVMIARADIDTRTAFKVTEIEKIKPIFENHYLIVVNKPAYLNSEEVEMQFPNAALLHRLDRETSGVLILVKDEDFREKCIAEFKAKKVYKEYVAVVEGKFIEEVEIDKPIFTEKLNNKAISRVSKQGKPSHTTVTPLEVSGRISKVKVVIDEGRTHQIRVHLKSIDFPIVGDELYGGRRSKRVMLHAKKVILLGKTYEIEEPKEFKLQH
ncbi:MAG: RNA pseudouridine synthase [Helicobacteraceae bacterium]|nr:RNA pseudouridine synthase [Helicobacteraceae bacterium]